MTAIRIKTLQSIEIALGCVLVGAAAMKCYQLYAGRSLILMSLFRNRLFLPAAFEGEFLIGIWLIFGGLGQLRRFVAAVTFFLFGVTAFFEAVRGSPSCGCFGNIPVPPIATALFDAFAVVVLVYFAKKKIGLTDRPLSRRQIIGIGAASILASICVCGAYFAEPATVGLVSGSYELYGGLVVLQPREWLGKSFPLFNHINGSIPMRSGRWRLVFYHYDCLDCLDAVTFYRALAANGDGIRTAFIAMPPLPSVGSDPVSDAADYLHLELSGDHEWFAPTPLVVAIQDGIVLAAEEGKSAVQPPDVAQWR
jgi:hypothetical protein